MTELPSGAVTFLFSDIEGSTRLVKALRDRYAQVLAEHRQLVRAAIAGHRGHEVDTQGDAFFAAFGEARQAVLCALDIQRSLSAHDWPEGTRVRLRMGIHTGQAVPVDGAYTGLAVHRAARICAAARGGQVLISRATQTIVEDEEEGEEQGFTLADIGEHRLKDLDRPVRLFQLVAPGLDPPGARVPEPDAAGVHGWPVALTSFVGRAPQVDEVTGLLGEFRLVTVLGPGGAGKTRLAAEVARRAAARFADGAWLVELAPVRDPAQVASVVAARVETLGVTQLLDRLDLLTAGDRAMPDRHRSLAATVDWSYQLLDEHERRVFRALSVFPGPFTLEAAEAVAGAGAGAAVLRLVDCSLLMPPRTGPDDRSRYAMLETLRTYGTELAAAGEQDAAAAALARYALDVAEQAAAGLLTTSAELAALRRLDAEDATTRQALAWAMAHDHAIAPRLAVALAPWWLLRGRAAGEDALLREAAGYAETGSQTWCDAQLWRGQTALHAADLAGALGRFTAVREALEGQGPSRALVEALCGWSSVLATQGRFAEAAEETGRALTMARTLGYPVGEALALGNLAITAMNGGDDDGALELIRQVQRIPGDIPGWLTRACANVLVAVLVDTGDLMAAEQVCTAALTQSRDAGDLRVLGPLLTLIAHLDLRAARIEDAAARLRESLQITMRTGIWFELINVLYHCAELCALTGRMSQALTARAAHAAFARREGFREESDADRRLVSERELRAALGPAEADAATHRGAAMSTATAAEYVLLLTAPAQRAAAPESAPESGPDAGPDAGPRALTARERELVTLVAQGRTDAQIAARLGISVRTVCSRLTRIRDKTGCRRRADLTRLALQAGLV